jgi:hypothetical protein
MKTLTILALMSTLATAAFTADNINFTPDDTTVTVLTREVGKKVDLRLKSGEKLSGTVKSVGNSCVHLGALAGQEYFDAVIAKEDISAVIIRNDGK